MKKICFSIAMFAVVIAVMVSGFLACQRTIEFSPQEGEKAFHSLLSQLQLVFPVQYKIIHYIQRPIRNSENGYVLEYYDLEVSKAEIPALVNKSKANIFWNNADPELLEVRPPIQWWKTNGYVHAYTGNIQPKPPLGHVYFTALEFSNSAHVFLEVAVAKRRTD